MFLSLHKFSYSIRISKCQFIMSIKVRNKVYKSGKILLSSLGFYILKKGTKSKLKQRDGKGTHKYIIYKIILMFSHIINIVLCKKLLCQAISEAIDYFCYPKLSGRFMSPKSTFSSWVLFLSHSKNSRQSIL